MDCIAMSLYKWFVHGLTLAILGPYILAPIHYYNQKKARDYSVSEFAIWSYSYVALHPPLCPAGSPGFICAAIDFSGLLHWSIAFFPRVCRCVLFKRLLFRHEFRNTHVQISMSEIQGYDIPPYIVVAISSFSPMLLHSADCICRSSDPLKFLCHYLRILVWLSENFWSINEYHTPFTFNDTMYHFQSYEVSSWFFIRDRSNALVV